MRPLLRQAAAAFRDATLLTVLAGLALLVPAWQFMLADLPALLVPYPFAVLAPAVLLGEYVLPGYERVALLAAMAILVAAFWLFARGPFRGDRTVPRRVFVAVLAIGALDLAWYFHEPQSGALAAVFMAANLALFALSIGLYFAARRVPSFALNLACHWLPFFWLAWCAFPYPVQAG